MDTNQVTNLVFVVGTQYYYDPNAVYVCWGYFIEGILSALFLYGVGKIYGYLRKGVGDW